MGNKNPVAQCPHQQRSTSVSVTSARHNKRVGKCIFSFGSLALLVMCLLLALRSILIIRMKLKGAGEGGGGGGEGA